MVQDDGEDTTQRSSPEPLKALARAIARDVVRRELERARAEHTTRAPDKSDLLPIRGKHRPKRHRGKSDNSTDKL